VVIVVVLVVVVVVVVVVVMAFQAVLNGLQRYIDSDNVK